MADSEVRIQPSCSKCNSPHLQFMAERESGEVLNKPSAYVMIARHVADSDSSVAENTRECMHAGTLNKNYWIYLHLTTKAPQYGREYMESCRRQPMAGCMYIHACFDAFVEFRGQKQRQNISSSLHPCKHTVIPACSIYVLTTTQANSFQQCLFFFLQPSSCCNHSRVCVRGWFRYANWRLRGYCVVCVAWFEGVPGWSGLFSLMKCSGCTEHYTHIKPSLAAFLLHSHCHALCTDLSMTLNKTVTFDLPSGNDQGDKYSNWYTTAAEYTVIVIVMVRVCVGMGANGACRVSCMLIAWTGALVNGGNVFSGIKGSKLRVLKELVTIDFARRAASQVHYMGALSSYCRQQGHCTNNRELGVSIPLLFRTKICFNHLLFCIHWL